MKLKKNLEEKWFTSSPPKRNKNKIILLIIIINAMKLNTILLKINNKCNEIKQKNITGRNRKERC